jgi:DNA-binding CsgD family transcriptional regulator
MDDGKLSELIADVYDCVIEPALWPTALQHIAAELKACTATIFTQDPVRQNIVFAHDWGSDPHWAGLYAAKYLPLNPALTFGWHAVIDQPGRMQDIMPLAQFRRSTFYNEWCRPQGICDLVLAILAKSATTYTAITASRPDDVGPTGKRELRIMGLLAPHIRRAVAIHGLVDRQASRAADLAAVIDLVATPVFLIDADGRCVETNAAADNFVAETGLLRIEGGVLAGDPGVAEQLAAITAASADALSPSTSLILPNGEASPFVGEILPLQRRGGRSNGVHRRAVAALFLREVGNLQPLPGELLVRLYGLSMAETRLMALLAQGFTLSDAGQTLGIAGTTARTHLQHIFEKTGVRRQSDLVRLVLSYWPVPTLEPRAATLVDRFQPRSGGSIMKT